MPSVCPRCDSWRPEEPHRRLAEHGTCEGQRRTRADGPDCSTTQTGVPMVPREDETKEK